MFSVSRLSLLHKVTNIESKNIAGCGVIPVRWRRMRHKPRAPSKFFVVREPTINAPGEDEFLKKHFPIYKTETKALMKLFKEQYLEKGVGGQDNLDRIKQEEEEHLEMMKVNAKWNAEVAAAREVRVAMELLEHRRLAKAAIERRTQVNLEKLEKVEEEVQRMKAKSSEFITMENIDAKLEEILDSRIDFNFAIDTEGKIYYPEGCEPEGSVESKKAKPMKEEAQGQH